MVDARVEPNLVEEKDVSFNGAIVWLMIKQEEGKRDESDGKRGERGGTDRLFSACMAGEMYDAVMRCLWSEMQSSAISM